MKSLTGQRSATRDRRGESVERRVADAMDAVLRTLDEASAGWAFDALEAGRDLVPYLQRRRASDVGRPALRAQGLEAGWRALSYRLVDLIAREGPPRDESEHDRLKQEVRAWVDTCRTHFRELLGLSRA